MPGAMAESLVVWVPSVTVQPPRLAGSRRGSEGGEPAIGIIATDGGAEFGAGEFGGGRAEGFRVDGMHHRMAPAGVLRIGPVTDELPGLAEPVIEGALFAAYAAMLPLVSLGPAREGEPVFGQGCQPSIDRGHAGRHDMEMPVFAASGPFTGRPLRGRIAPLSLAILMNNEQSLTVCHADSAEGRASGLEHGGMLGRLTQIPGEDEMGDDMLGFATGERNPGGAL